jgi:hypothetical protein
MKCQTSIVLSFLVIMVYWLMGCASMPPPKAEITRAEGAIEGARVADSEEYAPLELHNARKELQDAQTALTGENYQRAKRLAEQAQVDAQLAEQKALSAKAQKSVQELQEDMRLLRKEIGISEN